MSEKPFADSRSHSHWRSKPWATQSIVWEEEGEERFDGEFQLSTDQVASLDREWRLAYIGRLLRTAAYAYGVPPHGTPGRSTEGDVTPPIAWHEDAGSIARLVRGLNDILYGIPAPSRD